MFALLPEPEGGLWVGTLTGLDYLPPGGTGFVHFRHDPDDSGSLSNDRIHALHRDASGATWIGTRAGLDRFEPGSGRITRYPLGGEGDTAPLRSIRALHQDD